MAKQEKKDVKKEIKKFEFSKVATILDNIAKTVPIHIDKEIRERTYISTGNFVLNAALSGSLFGGIGDRGISVFGGPEASGKTFLALNVMREAQKLGHCVIYIDTEYAINRSELPKYGLDNSPEKFIIIRGNQVEELNVAITTLIDELKKAKLEGYELPKQIWALDSLGQLSSKKAKEDLLKGDIKADVGNKAKAIGQLFVSITADINYLNIPLLVCNQTYETMETYSVTIMKGGRQLYYSANNITFLTKAKLKDDKEADDLDIASNTGVVVTCKCVKNRQVKPKQVKIEISFEKGMNPYKGLLEFCRPEFFLKTGIGRGKMEVDKETGEMKFIPGSGKWYVEHLDKTFFESQMYNSEIFNKTVLESIEPIVNNYFKYKSLSEQEEVENEFEKMLNSTDEDESNGFSDSMDADELFS
jgi:RecA/RadA recombinase